MEPIDFTVSHRGTTHTLSLLPDTTMDVLAARLEELTTIPKENQKLLYKGKKAAGPDDTIVAAGLRSGLKMQVLGATTEELKGIKNVEEEYQRKERILRERALKPQVKLRSTGSPSPAAQQYRFHNIVPLLHLPEPASARKVLERLATDPAIRHVMVKHQFTVGTLTELAPHEQPHLLGLNVNAGQAIKLRLRTNDYEGFRPYLEVRRVLCHELTHNVWSDHDNNFKELNSQLNREVSEHERELAAGKHQLVDSSGAYEPELERDAQILHGGGGYVLGGQSAGSSGDSREDRRKRMLEATLKRLEKEEEELEQSCGTAGPSATSTGEAA